MLADRCRLQKLTGSAWPVAPSSEELLDHDAGSSPLARERSRERKSAGSRTVGGKAAVPVAGSEADKATDEMRKHSPRSTLSMEGALDRMEAGTLTRARGRRFWFSQAESTKVGKRGSATGSVRGTSSATREAEKARAE